MKKISAIAGVIGANLILTVLLLEALLRLIPLPAGFSNYLKTVGMIEEQQAAYIQDPQTGMTVLQPGQSLTWSIMDAKWTVTTVPFPGNAQLGFRDDGIDPEAKRKVFALGDSFTFGFGVNDDQVWHEVLERKYGGDIDIFNLRAIGSSVVDISYMYPLYKERFQHDTVFLCIYLGNEFMDAGINARRFAKETTSTKGAIAKGTSETSNRGIQGELFAQIKSHSYTARLAKYLFLSQWTKLGYYNLDTRREVYQPEDSPFVFTIDHDEIILVRTCEKEYSTKMQEGVAAFEQSLVELVQLVRQDGKQIYVFIFPFKEQVYWDQWVHRLEKPKDYERFKPNTIVGEALESQGVEFYDLTEDLIEAGRDKVIYWPIDSHWNPVGNDVAAELISKWLLRHDFP
jgi:hypothetical protein